MSDLTRRQFLRTAAVTAGAVAGGGLLAACGSSTKAAATATAAAPLTKVTYQLGWKKLVQFGGHFAALELGYFKDEGLDVSFLSGGPNIDVFNVVNSGQAMMGDANGSDIIKERLTGAPVKAFATIYQETPNALMSLKSKPVTSLTDLPGKTVAVPAGENQLISALVKNAGGDPSKIKFAQVGTDPGILTSGQVDAYIGYGTEQGVDLELAGVPVEIVYFGQLGDPDYGNAIFATDTTIAAKHDVLAKWLRADIKGWQYCVDHPEDTAKMVWTAYHNETEAVLVNEQKSATLQAPLITSGVAGTHGLMWVDEQHFQTVGQLYEQAGLLTGSPDYSSVFTQAVLTAAGDKA